ncbi:Kdo hydroxylase family protein [Pseudoduganella sp. RAF53_2]|uniref:Kdo hydroxylase family protein n=1 Tax=unclassified Pseudoduganella TaxID=2637179 RepID=UPI003F9DD83E
MESLAVPIDRSNLASKQLEYAAELEAGKVLLLNDLTFTPSAEELKLFRPDILSPKSRNISLGADDRLKGAAGNEDEQKILAAMILRFRNEAEAVLNQLLPKYGDHLKRGATSFRPATVESRVQSWRADDRRLHVDAFPSRPNRGERLLRLFLNVNPNNVPRVWRVGEPFQDIARRFVPRAKPYVRWQADWLNKLGVTKTFRTEYDHLMLQLHDGMKQDMEYQRTCRQEVINFAPGTAWICFSDQLAHSVISGQFLMEYTVQLPPDAQYDVDASPLAILSRMTARQLV